MTVVEALTWTIALAACVSAARTKRLTAWPLMASWVLCWFLNHPANQFPFDPMLWAAIDLAVIWTMAYIALTRRPGEPEFDRKDIVVIVLFVVGWVFSYTMADPWRYWVGSAVVISQFLVTMPAESAFRALSKRLPGRRGGTTGQGFDIALARSRG